MLGLVLIVWDTDQEQAYGSGKLGFSQLPQGLSPKDPNTLEEHDSQAISIFKGGQQ